MKDSKKAKVLKHFLSLEYPMVVKKDIEDDVFVVEFPDFPGCVAHGKTPTSAFRDAKAAKREWIEIALSLGRSIPEPKREEEFSGRFSLRLPKHDHKRLAEQAKVQGRSLNQHIQILLSDRGRALDLDKSIDAMKKLIDELQIQKMRVILNDTTKTNNKIYVFNSSDRRNIATSTSKMEH